MEKLIYIFFIFFFSVQICVGQSRKTIITIKEISNEMDSSLETMDFRDFCLYLTHTPPIVFTFRDITDSTKVCVHIDFHIKSDFIDIKSIRLGYMDRPLKLSKKDSLKIANLTFKLLREKASFYIKYYNNVNQDRTYYLQMPIILTRKKGRTN